MAASVYVSFSQYGPNSCMIDSSISLFFTEQPSAREIERMLLSGRRLTVPYLMARYSVGKNAIRRDFDIIGGELPIIVKRGSVTAVLMLIVDKVTTSVWVCSSKKFPPFSVKG